MIRFGLLLIIPLLAGFHLETFAQEEFLTTYQIDSIVEVSKALPPSERIEKISSLIDSHPNIPVKIKAKAYIEIGIGYSRLNRFSSAIAHYDKAAALSKAAGDKVNYSRALNLRGISYNHLHQFDKAIESLQNALAIRMELGDKLLIASTLNNLAVSFRVTNQLDAAIENYHRSITLYKEVGDLAGQSFALNNIGLVLIDQQEYGVAIDFLTQSLDLKKQLDDTLKSAITYYNLGRVYLLTEQYKLAINNLETAAELYKAADNIQGLTDCYNSIARVYLSNDEYTKALSNINLAKSLIHFNETSTLALENIKIQSDYYLAVGNAHKSRELLADYIQRYQEVQNTVVNNQIAELSFMYENERMEQEKNLLEKNLDIEKLRVQKAHIKQYAITFVALLFLALLIASLFFIRKYMRKGDELERLNTELNHMNSHLETIVDSRTQDLLETLRKAQESDKQKSAFLASMSHEIRTPLNGILGFSKLLIDETLTQSERNQYVGLINRRGRNLLQIVNDIINYSLIDSGQVKVQNTSFNLNLLMYDLYSMFSSGDYDKRRSQVELRLNLGLSDSRSVILSDPNRIEQIINNLIDNAFKFTSSGIVEYGYDVLPNNTIKFFVRDTGPGIPPEKKSIIFSRFNRTDEELAKGFSTTGLGLPICKGLIELLNGKIWFDTKVDQGTTFYFTIPFVPGKPESKSYVSRSSVHNISFKGKLILVVEDDLISYQFIEALLVPTDVKIIHAKNGEDAIEIVKIRSDIDLIVMDMRLPFIDGYEATARIKSSNPQMTIIAQTANAMSYDREKCLSVGCDDYMPKPIDPDDFLRTVAYHLKKPALA